MSLFSYSNFDIPPTVGEVKDDISRMMGMKEIKAQLMTILNKIVAAEKEAFHHGTKIVPPKPFHMAFVGNSGTGKSMVARVLGKLFYLSGALPSHNLIEMRGHQRARINKAKGGVLLIDVDEQEEDCEVLQEIVDVMDSGETAVVFAGKRKHLNRCMHGIDGQVYKRLSVALHFSDFSCEELAMMLLKRLRKEDSSSCDQVQVDILMGNANYKLHSSCSIGTVGKMIESETAGKEISKLNGNLIEPMVQQIRKSLALRFSFDAPDDEDPNIITNSDLKAAISNMAKIYTNLIYRF